MVSSDVAAAAVSIAVVSALVESALVESALVVSRETWASADDATAQVSASGSICTHLTAATQASGLDRRFPPGGFDAADDRACGEPSQGRFEERDCGDLGRPTPESQQVTSPAIGVTQGTAGLSCDSILAHREEPHRYGEMRDVRQQALSFRLCGRRAGQKQSPAYPSQIPIYIHLAWNGLRPVPPTFFRLMAHG